MANTRFKTENGLYVTGGNAEFTEIVSVTGNCLVYGELFYVGGNLHVVGNTYITGVEVYDADIAAGSSGLKIGNTTYQFDVYAGTVYVKSSITPLQNTKLTISGNTDVIGTANVQGNANVSGTLGVAGIVTAGNLNSNVVNASSNVNIGSAHYLNTTAHAIGANIVVNTSTFALLGNSVVSTVTVNSSLIQFGNTTVANSPVITVQNTTGTANLAPSGLVVGNTVINSTSAVIANINVSSNVVSKVVKVGNTAISSNTTLITSTTSTVIDSFPKTESTGAKYFIVAMNTGNTVLHSIELSLVQDSSFVLLSQYGEIYNTSLGSFDATINNANVEVSFTATGAPSVGTPYTIKLQRTQII